MNLLLRLLTPGNIHCLLVTCSMSEHAVVVTPSSFWQGLLAASNTYRERGSRGHDRYLDVQYIPLGFSSFVTLVLPLGYCYGIGIVL